MGLVPEAIPHTLASSLALMRATPRDGRRPGTCVWSYPNGRNLTWMQHCSILTAPSNYRHSCRIPPISLWPRSHVTPPASTLVEAKGETEESKGKGRFTQTYTRILILLFAHSSSQQLCGVFFFFFSFGRVVNPLKYLITINFF